MKQVLTFLALNAGLTVAGCIHVSDTGAVDHDVRTVHCAVECPDDGEARVACAVPKIPACSCEPRPIATCTSPERRGS